MPVVSLAEMLQSGVHFGHQTRRWNPKMDPYIFTSRNGVHIIDLVQTAVLMEEAYIYMRNASAQGKKILFVGTKRQAAGIIAEEAKRCGSYYINQRWLGGMLTNWETIKTRVERLKELEALEESGNIERRPKKEGSVLRRELGKLEKYLGGIKTMRGIPDIVVIVDQRREYNAILECQKLGLPLVSLLDSNCDPDLADVHIPANDDAIRSIKLIIGKLADAIYEGRHGKVDSDEQYEEFEQAVEAIDYDEEEDEEVPEAVAEEAPEASVETPEAVAEEVPETSSEEASSDSEEAPEASSEEKSNDSEE